MVLGKFRRSKYAGFVYSEIMETIFDRLFHKRDRAEADDAVCDALHYPVERTGCEPADEEAALKESTARADAARKELPLLPRLPTRLKLPIPAKREITVDDFTKLDLNRETVEILKDDKIATGG